MPVFISYSHHDKDFVDTLARQLVQQKVSVWVDRWELHVGDSLIQRVQEAIGGASGLLVVLSNASVVSEWCKKELSAGLIRELAEKRVVVLPILVEDCEIPMFLKDKLYADFRTNFDEGLKTTLESLAKVTTAWQSRSDAPKWHTDWALDWGEREEKLFMRLTMVEQAKDQPYSVLSVVEIMCDEEATNLYTESEAAGKGEEARVEIIGLLSEAIDTDLDLTVTLDDQFERTASAKLQGQRGESYLVRLCARRLGEDTGRDIVLHHDQQIRQAFRHMKEVLISRTDAER